MRKTGPRLLVLIVMLGLVLAGCSGGNDNEGSEGTEGGLQDSDEKVTINVFAHQSSDVDLKTNKFTKNGRAIRHQVQLDNRSVRWCGRKRQISLASGDYPDLYMLIPWVDRFSQTDLLKFGQQG